MVSSLVKSETLNKMPLVSVDYVFAERGIFDRAIAWLNTNRADIIQLREEENHDGTS